MSNYKQSVSGVTRFTKSPVAELEYSRMRPTPTLYTTMNAGDIVPIYCQEVLPHETLAVSLDFVIRQTTSLTPVMGQMDCDIFAFFVQNRVVNQSWKNVQGENSSGYWNAPEVSLVPLYRTSSDVPSTISIPVGSVADYYGFPTQQGIPTELLQQCHDLKFRGYLEVYNNYFRDENYQPPIPYSKLNLYNGFLEPVGANIPLAASGTYATTGSNLEFGQNHVPDGSNPYGAVVKAIYGEGDVQGQYNQPGYGDGVGLTSRIAPRLSSWSALDFPLKANKRHDLFTSVLPTPQKGPQVSFSVAGGTIPVDLSTTSTLNPLNGSLRIGDNYGSDFTGPLVVRNGYVQSNTGDSTLGENVTAVNVAGSVNLDNAIESITVDELRMSFALQHTYETLARGGSRYRELLASFFELDTIDNFPDTPTLLGKYSRGLDLYQTAQTSASVDGGTPQGNLSAYGYTNSGGYLFKETFLEHGYVHIFAVIRHRNVYSSGISRDNFRLNTLDFYLPTLANISEQPVYTREINAFSPDREGIVGYNEAWYEYREEPDRATGLMRTGVSGSLGEVWTYADGFDPTFVSVDGDWLKSNSEEVLSRSLAVTSEPQFRCQFVFKIDKQLPMPTFSVPGLDTL